MKVKHLIEYLVHQPMDAEVADGPVMNLEWANCRACHSTLANEGGAQ